MRIFAVVTGLLSCALSAGCGACAYPFSVEAEGRLNLPLGVVEDCAGTDTIENDKDGSVTVVTHHLEGFRCVMHVDWQGPLVDMEELRDDVEKDIRAAGLDPADVDVHVSSITPSVDTAGLAASGRDVTLPAGALVYRGAVSVEGDPEVIVVELDAERGIGASATEPAVTVRESETLVELANVAWDTQRPLLGTATADVIIDLARIQNAELPERPKLRVEFAVLLEGDASL